MKWFLWIAAAMLLFLSAFIPAVVDAQDIMWLPPCHHTVVVGPPIYVSPPTYVYPPVYVQPQPVPVWHPGGWEAHQELRTVDEEIEGAIVDVDAHTVAVAHQPDGTPVDRLGRDVPHA